MVNVFTLIPECESHIPVFLDVFISSNPSICFTVALIPLANSDHAFDSISIDVPSN